MTSSSNKRSPLVSIIIALIAIGLIATYSSFFTGSSNNSSRNTSSIVDNNDAQNSIVYSGKDGIDALTLLKENHSVDVSGEGFVNSIDDIKPAEKQYWALYVNKQLSMTGAKETITKTNDTIEWKLDSY